MNKNFLWLLVLLMSIVVLAACNGRATPPQAPPLPGAGAGTEEIAGGDIGQIAGTGAGAIASEPPPITRTSNSMGFFSGINAAQGDNWIFYSHSGNLYRISINDDSVQLLVDGRSSGINVSSMHVHGDWIYCTAWSNAAGDFGIYRIRIDGSEIQNLGGHFTGVDIIGIDGNIIYFQPRENPGAGDNPWAGNYIKKMYIDGSGVEVLMSFEQRWQQDEPWFTGVMLVDGWIYGGGGSVISRFNPTNRTLEEVASSIPSLSNIRYYDGWIYYQSPSLSHVYRMRRDGSEKQNVIDENVMNYVVLNNTIYYINFSRRLISTSVVGNSESIVIYEITDPRIGEIDIAGGWIHLAYRGVGGDRARIRMRLDGSNVQYMADVIARSPSKSPSHKLCKPLR